MSKEDFVIFFILGLNICFFVACDDTNADDSIDYSYVDRIAVADNEYKNPVYRDDHPDPTVIKSDDGYYYSLSTGIKTYLRSSNLYEWQNTGVSPISDETRSFIRGEGKAIWAPDIVNIGGKTLMYLSVVGEDVSVAVLEADRCNGEFRFDSYLTNDRDNGWLHLIDTEVVEDPETRKVWMFAGSYNGIYRTELSKDGKSLLNSEFIHVAGNSILDDESRSTVFEGAYLYRREGFWYLFASAGESILYNYKIVVGRSEKIDGVFYDRKGRRMSEGYAETILSSNEEDMFWGPGHNGEIIEDRNGNTYMFYHCHDKRFVNSSIYGIRTLMLQEIKWDNEGWPYFDEGKPSLVCIKPEI